MRHADCVHWLRYAHSSSREQVSQHPSPSVKNGRMWHGPARCTAAIHRPFVGSGQRRPVAAVPAGRRCPPPVAAPAEAPALAGGGAQASGHLLMLGGALLHQVQVELDHIGAQEGHQRQ